MPGQARVEVVGELIVARVSGTPDEAIIRDCQERILTLVREHGVGRVLYDTLAMQAPPVDIPWFQRELDAQLGAVKLRRAIVVPDSKLAYLARLAFGEGDYRVFYNDVHAALTWLGATESPMQASA